MSKDYKNHRILANRLGNINTRLRAFSRQIVALEDARTQVYDAVVSPNVGEGDYFTVSQALDAGARSIFVRPGTYVENISHDIRSRVIIVGESTETCILVFEGLSTPAFDIKNDDPILTTGTISVVNGSDQVVGAGTDFTSLSSGDQIIIVDTIYDIESVEDATNLTLRHIYRGNSRSGVVFIATKFISPCIFRQLTIQNSATNPCTSDAIKGIGLNGSYWADLHIDGFVQNATFEHCYDLHIVDCHSENSNAQGWLLSDCISAFANRSGAANNVGNGFEITGATVGSAVILISECESINNGGNGVNMGDGSNLINFVNCQVINNMGDGIRSTNGTTNIVLSACNIKQNTVGVNLSGSNNLLTSNTITENTGVGVRAGDESLISSNYIASNGSYGIHMQSDINNIINGNHIDSCSNSGIYSSGNSTNATISNNHVDLNTNYAIYLNGQGSNALSGNICRNNTIAGIRIADSNNAVNGNIINTHTTGVVIDSGANNNLLVGNHYTDNTTPLTDGGTGTIAVNNSI